MTGLPVSCRALGMDGQWGMWKLGIPGLEGGSIGAQLPVAAAAWGRAGPVVCLFAATGLDGTADGLCTGDGESVGLLPV